MAEGADIERIKHGLALYNARRLRRAACHLAPDVVRAKGASSGVELDTRGWHVWTMRAGRGVRMVATFDEGKARAALELGQNDST